MTRVTTITEYDTPDGKVVMAHNCEGLSGNLVYANDEAVIKYSDSDGEPNQYNIHPEDAMPEFLSIFFS